MGSSKGTDDSVGWANLLSDVSRDAPTKGISPSGEGWKTMNQLHTEMGFGVCKTRKIIRQMIVDGKIESFAGSAPSPPPTGELCRQVWYRPISNKK